MSFDDPKFWLQVVLVLWNCGLSAAMWLRKPGTDAAAAVKELTAEIHGRLATHDNDITTIKTRMESMPSSEELTELEGSVREVMARLEGVVQSMQTMQISVSRIEHYLLNSKT